MNASTLVEVKSEVTHLKREIRSLKMKNKDLVDELASSQDDLGACRQTLYEVSALRKSFSQPPPEILHMIFERTIPPHFLVDSSLSFLPNSLWCQVQEQKYSLVNVCRTWYIIGLPFLYTVISIRRIYQILNLLRTLKTSSPNLNLKEMIKTVEILCPVPVSYGLRFEQQLRVLFNVCPRISSCSFVSQVPPFGLPPTVLLCALVPNVTSLELNDGVKLDTLQNILQLAAPHIVSLSFYAPYTATIMHRTNFYHLEDLSLWCGAGAVNALVRNWKMPRLNRLTFDESFGMPELKEFCDVHGARLQYLHLTRGVFHIWSHTWGGSGAISGAISRMTYNPKRIPALGDSCPALEHIVLPPFSGPLAHKGIKWLDIWVSDFPGQVEEVRSEIQGANLPALKGVRLLPYPSNKGRHNLPLIFPPTLVSDPTDAFTFPFSDLVIRHDVGQIYYIRPPRAGDLVDDDWEAFEPDTSDDKNDEGSDEGDSDGSFIPDESDYSDGSIDWHIDFPNQVRVTIRDWELEDGPETDSSWLENI